MDEFEENNCFYYDGYQECPLCEIFEGESYEADTESIITNKNREK